MNNQNAEIIVKKYGGIIANSPAVFKKQSSLPCSKAKIRMAFFIYIESIIKELGRLPKEHGESLVTTYSMLDSFVSDEEADRLNKIPQQIESKELNGMNEKDGEIIQEYFKLVPKALRNGIYFNEINNFIQECYEKQKK